MLCACVYELAVALGQIKDCVMLMSKALFASLKQHGYSTKAALCIVLIGLLVVWHLVLQEPTTLALYHLFTSSCLSQGCIVGK